MQAKATFQTKALCKSFFLNELSRHLPICIIALIFLTGEKLVLCAKAFFLNKLSRHLPICITALIFLTGEKIIIMCKSFHFE